MTFWTNRLRKKNIENIAAGTSIITTKLAARVRLARIRNGSSGCATRRSMTMNARAAATPTDQRGERPGVAPAVALVAGAGEAVDEGEQAEGAGEGAGEVELRRGGDSHSRGTAARARAATMPIGTLIRKVSRQPSTAVPNRSRFEPGQPAAEDQADGRAGAGHRGVDREGAVALRTGREGRGDQRERGGGGERGAEALEAAGAEQQAPRSGRGRRAARRRRRSTRPSMKIRRRP